MASYNRLWPLLLIVLLAFSTTQAVQVNLLPNGDFEQLNTDPLLIEMEDVLPANSVSVQGASQGKGAILPRSMEIWGYVTFNLPRPLKRGPYLLEMHVLGNDSGAPDVGFYDGTTLDHEMLFAYGGDGSGKFKTLQKRFTINKEMTTLVVKKVSAAKLDSNPIDWIKITPLSRLDEFALQWDRLGKESQGSWQLDTQKVHSGQYAMKISGAKVDHVGIISDFFPVGRQQYELSAWYALASQDAKIQFGIRWYATADQFLREDYLTGGATAGNWQQLTMSVIPPARSALARVFVTTTGLGDDELWLDSFSFLGDPTVLPRGEPVPLTLRGFASSEVNWRPETGLFCADKIGIYSDFFIEKPIKVHLKFDELYEGLPFKFTETPLRPVTLWNQSFRVTLEYPVPGLPIKSISLGSLEVTYSPYIATIGYFAAGGWTVPYGVNVTSRILGWDNDFFTFWRLQEQVLGSKFSGSILDTNLNLTGLVIRSLLPAQGTDQLVSGPVQEQAISVEAKRQLPGNWQASGVYNLLAKAGEANYSSYNIKMQQPKLMPGIGVALSSWFCDPKFKPRYYDKTPKGYDYSLGYYQQGNWVDNRNGQRGVGIELITKHEPLEIRSSLEAYNLVNQNTKVHKFKADGVTTALGNKVTFAWEKRNTWLSYFETSQQGPIWQKLKLGLERVLQRPKGEPIVANLWHEEGQMALDGYQANELRLTRKWQRGLLRGLTIFGGIRQEKNSLTGKQNYLKFGSNYNTPGGIKISLVLSTPNLPQQGYFDDLREEWYEIDNELKVFLSTSF